MPTPTDGGLKTWVYQQMEINGITEVNEEQGYVILKVFIRFYWNDTRLAWDPKQYCNITKTYLPGDPEAYGHIWTPWDIYLHKDGGWLRLEGMQHGLAIVQHNGTVMYSRAGLLKVLVDFDVRNWPFDRQVVNMTFATKDYSVDRLNISFH